MISGPNPPNARILVLLLFRRRRRSGVSTTLVKTTEEEEEEESVEAKCVIVMYLFMKGNKDASKNPLLFALKFFDTHTHTHRERKEREKREEATEMTTLLDSRLVVFKKPSSRLMIGIF